MPADTVDEVKEDSVTLESDGVERSGWESWANKVCFCIDDGGDCFNCSNWPLYNFSQDHARMSFNLPRGVGPDSKSSATTVEMSAKVFSPRRTRSQGRSTDYGY